MTLRKLVAIFADIDSDNYSEEEKALAIYEVLNMPTHMGIKKDEMLRVIKWLWDKCYVMAGDTE